MSLKQEQIHLFISGRVQGVGFRWATHGEASRLGLTGWVRNTTDGRVEAVAEGDSATLERFLAWCRQGPPTARVDAVEIRGRRESPPEFPEFSIRRDG